MLAKEKDPQSDAWFDAYFGWLCNRDMNTITVGGGGGWGYNGFYRSGDGDVYNEVNSLINSENGGFWSRGSGTYYYRSQDEAFKMSCFFIEANNLWSTTYGGDFNSAINVYDGGRLADEIRANNPKYFTASLDGGGSGTISLQDLAPKQDFSGFWGGVKYFFNGGNIGGYHYNIKGEVIGLALITGMAPTPGLKGSSIRSSYQKSNYLRELAESGKLPKWMNQWLKSGKVPPGYQVDHKIPLSIGGQDIPSNMRLNQTLNHWMHHIYYYYHPWRP